MRLRRLRAIALLGIGIASAALLPARGGAQVPVKRDTVTGRRDTINTRVDTLGGRRNLPPAGRDTVRIPVPARADSMLRNDSINKGIVPLPKGAPRGDSLRRDTLKAPLTRAEAPPILEIGAARVYDRAAIYATGAVTLSDLLGRVPGLTEFTAGWLGAPAVVASQGDLRRVRLFLDGLELDPMDRRARGVAPINDMPLHSLEELRIERGADEVRVYGRTWRVDRTDPYTRADIATGDQNTNLYRAYFGRRFDHGEALQVAAEQFNTQPQSALPSSDALNLMARLGIARGPWSADAMMERSDRSRAQWTGVGNSLETLDTIPSIETRRSTAYVRFGNGDPDRGRWVQALASAHSYRLSPRASTDLGTLPPSQRDSIARLADTTAYDSQYLVTGGITRGAAKVSAAERVRISRGLTSHVLSARGSFASGPLSTSVFAEGRSVLNPGRIEGTVRFAPLARVALIASGSRTGSGLFDRLLREPTARPFDSTGKFLAAEPGFLSSSPLLDTSEVRKYVLPARTSARAEIGVRLRDLWLAVGMMRRGATTLLPPGEIDARYAGAGAVRIESEATARTVSARGRLYRAINIDAWAVAWNDSMGVYRPRYQTRTELFLQTNLLDRFPRGNFGILTSLAHEYRSSALFPIVQSTLVTSSPATQSYRVSPDYRNVDFKLEIRIQSAVVSYQFRNLLQDRHSEIPGFNLPRQTQFYGVRWDFWN